jgi:hypothetical protein
MKTIVVVGDKFEEFARRHENVVTLSEFERKVWDGPLDDVDRIVLGQGVCRHRIATLREVILARTPGRMPLIVNPDLISDQTDPRQVTSVHKARRENVLITAPRRQADDTYISKLAIQDAAELLNDHMTGQHVQGIVLFEAARQMMLSVSERYLLLPEERNKRYFVLHDVISRYHQFAFPFNIEVELKVLSQERKPNGALHATVSTRFLQNGIELTEIEIRYAAYTKEFIAGREHSMAASRLSEYLGSVHSLQPA